MAARGKRTIKKKMGRVKVGTLFLDQEYRKLVLSLPDIRVAIMGVDPYPTNPTGMAFCRQTWNEMLSRASAGLFVLESLGVDIYEVSDETSVFPTPSHYFFYLAAVHGVVFINASNHFVGAKRNEDTETYFVKSRPNNIRIINKARATLLCGDIPQKLYKDIANTVPCLHPSQNRPRFRRQWLLTWAPNRLKKQFGLNFGCSALPSCS